MIFACPRVNVRIFITITVHSILCLIGLYRRVKHLPRVYLHGKLRGNGIRGRIEFLLVRTFSEIFRFTSTAHITLGRMPRPRGWGRRTRAKCFFFFFCSKDNPQTTASNHVIRETKSVNIMRGRNEEKKNPRIRVLTVIYVRISPPPTDPCIILSRIITSLKNDRISFRFV